jgi:hypothetical protein
MAPGRTLKVEVVAGTANCDSKQTCVVKLLDLALRELKKETFRTKSVPSRNGLPFEFPVSWALRLEWCLKVHDTSRVLSKFREIVVKQN